MRAESCAATALVSIAYICYEEINVIPTVEH